MFVLHAMIHSSDQFSIIYMYNESY